MTVQYLSKTGKLTSKKNGNEFIIVHTIRRASARDNVVGSLVCNQIFVSPSDEHLFDKCVSGQFYDLVYDTDGRFTFLKEVNETSDEF